MAQTTNYGLILYEPNDVTSYLVGWNATMNKVDNILGTIASTANTAAADSVANAGSIRTINNHLTTVDDELADNLKSINANTSSINGLSTNVTNLTGDVNVLSGKVDGVVDKFGDWFTGSISPSETQLTIQIPSAADTDVIEIYSDVYGWSPTGVDYQTNSNQIVLTFDAVTENIQVKVWRRSLADIGEGV